MSNKELDELLNELNSFLEDGEPEQEVEEKQLAGHTFTDFNREEVAKEKVIPLITQILNICEDHKIPAQFVVFPKCEGDSVFPLLAKVNADRRIEVQAADLVYNMPHSIAHFLLGMVTSIGSMFAGAMVEGAKSDPFDKLDLYDKEIVPLVEELAKVCEKHQVYVQWGMIVAVDRKGEATARWAAALPEEFANCQILAAIACYKLPQYVLDDLIELAEEIGRK